MKGEPISANQLFLFPAEILYVCRGNINEFHEHYALSLWISFQGEFEYETSALHRGKAVVLAPNVRHRLYAPDCSMAVVQVDPDAPAYRTLLQLTSPGAAAHLPERFESISKDFFSLLERPDCGRAHAFLESLVSIASAGLPAVHRPLDRRIEQALARIRAMLPEAVSTAELAEEAGLSVDRFMHLFKEEMGLPVRRYILWLRANLAVRLLKQGLSLTEAAHEAGFSDSAHMSRTFKDMVGIHPSFFFKDSRFVQAHFCSVV